MCVLEEQTATGKSLSFLDSKQVGKLVGLMSVFIRLFVLSCVQMDESLSLEHPEAQPRELTLRWCLFFGIRYPFLICKEVVLEVRCKENFSNGQTSKSQRE